MRGFNKHILIISGIIIVILVAPLFFETAFAKDQPFQKQVGLMAEVGSCQSAPPQIINVPRGKWLVIEFISVIGSIEGAGNSASIMITTLVDGVVAHYVIPLNKVGVDTNSPNPEIFQLSQQMKVYADPGSEVGVILERRPCIERAMFGASISGRLTDSP